MRRWLFKIISQRDKVTQRWENFTSSSILECFNSFLSVFTFRLLCRAQVEKLSWSFYPRQIEWRLEKRGCMYFFLRKKKYELGSFNLWLMLCYIRRKVLFSIQFEMIADEIWCEIWKPMSIQSPKCLHLNRTPNESESQSWSIFWSILETNGQPVKKVWL